MLDTPWGNLAVGDAHVHFFSHRFFAGLARQKNVLNPEALGPLLGWDIPAAPPDALAVRWVAELDRHGVERACLIASAHGDEESVAQAVAAFPKRFRGYFMLDPTQPDALDRVAKAASNPNLHCVCLFPAMHRYSMSDARLVPILERISAGSRLAVFVHCGALSVGVRSKLGLPSLFDLRFSNPIDLHPVALQFLKIRFVVPHFGAGMLREALMLADLCPNVYLDTSSTNRWMNYDGLDLGRVFRRAIDVVGLERILFGTDSSFFPRGWQAALFHQQARALYEIGLSAPQAVRILSENLEALFA
jgi:predicted TIM-barrel fold metal-dependent hydrolase